MITFSELPAARKAEINKVARAVSRSFKVNGFDTTDIVKKIRQNLIYLYNNEQAVTDSIFSLAYKTAWNLNSNEILNDWDSLEVNPKRIRLSGFGIERIDESYSIQQTGGFVTLSAPVSVTDIQIFALGVYVRQDGTFIQNVSEITPIQVFEPSVGNAGVGAIDAFNQGNTLQFVFVVTKGFKRKMGTEMKYIADSKSVDGVTLLPVLT